MDAEEIAVTIRNAIKDIPSHYDWNMNRIEQIQNETDDLIHMLELTNFNASEGYKISRRLKEIRMERRILKDENDLLRPMVGELTNMKNKKGVWDAVVGNVRKVKAGKRKRFYKCKHRIDLQDKINAVKL